MEWWQALLLGILQGLTEFLPVSSSGHLMIFKEALGVDGEGFLDFTVLVHFATVLSTIVVFWRELLKIFAGIFKFRYNDETDYALKIIVSMIPVAIVGFFMKDWVEGLFGGNLLTVATCLLITAFLLLLSDNFTRMFSKEGLKINYYGNISESKETVTKTHRNGISYLQAIIVGVGQAFAVFPGLSRSGTTIATGIISGVRRDVMAQFSFLMVLVPIIGEQTLDLLESDGMFKTGQIDAWVLLLGFLGAFFAGLFACKVMISIVKKAKLKWFALYCAVVALAIFAFYAFGGAPAAASF